MSRRRTLLATEVRQQSMNADDADADVVDENAEKEQRHAENGNSSIRITRKPARSNTTNADSNLNKSQHQLPAVPLPPKPKPNNEQLSCLYNNCIKLLNENKINQKNAFELKLIDYLGDIVLNKHIVGGDTNFQVVGCTIDAGTKIYAARVDALHQNTYQMLSGLGHDQTGGDDGAIAQNADGNVDGKHDPLDTSNADQDGDQAKQKRMKNKRRAKKSNHICENPDQINMKNTNYDSVDVDQLDNETDIYFTTISTAIEQQAIAGLLNNKIIIENDLAMNIIINKDDLYFDTNDMLVEHATNDTRILVKSLVDLTDVKLKRIVQCKLVEHLKAFSFTNWTMETEDGITDLCETLGNQRVDTQDDLEQHRFDKNLNELDARRFNDIDPNNSNLDYHQANMPDIDVDHDDMDAELPIGPNSNQSGMNAFDDLRSLHSIAELTQLIGTDTSDYSYFNFDRLKLHDLPKNLKAFVLRMNTANSQSGTQQQQQQDQILMQPPQKVDRRRKEMPKLDLSIVLDRSKFFKVTKKAIFISDRAIENRLDKSHNLETERELDYSARKLLQPYGKNIQAKLITSDCDFENIDNLLGDQAAGATAQKHNQTINEHQAPDDNDDFDVGLGDAAGGMHDDFDMAPGTMQPFFTQNGGEFDLLTQNPNEQRPLGDHIGSDNTENIVVDGDYLIKAPEQVNPLNIDYAKTAKSIDARRLKYVMWNLICSLSNDKENVDSALSNNGVNDSSSIKAQTTRNINCSFTTLYKMIKPPLVSQRTYDDLSVCIAFQMLLFLANEHGLELKNREDGCDLCITTAPLETNT